MFHMCAEARQWSQKRILDPLTVVLGSCEPSCVYEELKQSPL